MTLLDRQELILMSEKPYGKQFVCYCIACHRHILSMRRYKRHKFLCKSLNLMINGYYNGLDIQTSMTKYHRCIICNKRMETDTKRAKKKVFIACDNCRVKKIEE